MNQTGRSSEYPFNQYPRGDSEARTCRPRNAISCREGGVPLSQSALSQHLGILRDSGILATMRESQSIIYSLPPGIATRIIGLLHDEFCPH